MGFGLIIELIEHLQLVTTNHYNAVTNLHTLQIIMAHAEP
jgi:hypothetical protein